MTRDAKESLVALAAVLFLIGALWLLPPLLGDIEIPRWLQIVGFGLQVAILAWLIFRRRRESK